MKHHPVPYTSSIRTRLTAAVVIILSVVGCQEKAAPTEDPLLRLFSGEMTVIDLTHSLSTSNPVWGKNAESPFSYTTLAAHESGRSIMGSFSTAEHYGTHIDAPTHGGENLPTVDELEPKDLLGPLVVIDISTQSAADSDYELSVADLTDWESRYGPIPDRAIVLAYTGWSQKWSDHEAYLNRDETGQLHFPGFSKAAAQSLIADHDILGIGIDNMSVDPGAADGFPAHGVVNGNGKFHLENVANVHELPPSGAYLIVAPVKVEGGSGGPVRLYAVVR